MLRRVLLRGILAVLFLCAPTRMMGFAAADEATVEDAIAMILFLRDHSRICVVDINSGSVRELAQGTSPCWSPDRARFAHIGSDATIVVRSLAGEELRTYTTDLDKLAELRWSPDGERLAFIGRTTYWSGNVYLLNLVSGEVAAVATPHAAADRTYANLSWSPTSDRLLYGFGGGHPKMLIASLADGTEEEIEFKEAAIVTYADWSPDGEWLAFSHSNVRIRKVRLDGTGMFDVTSTTLDVAEGEPRYQDLSLSWSPDAAHIVFSRVRRPAEGGMIFDGLWVVDVDGGNLSRLTDGQDTQPDWG